MKLDRATTVVSTSKTPEGLVRWRPHAVVSLVSTIVTHVRVW